MSKNKKLSKEEHEAEIKALRDRKDRDAKLGYKYSPCPFCGKAVRWRLPNGVEDNEESIKKYQPIHCYEEECSKAFLVKNVEERKSR